MAYKERNERNAVVLSRVSTVSQELESQTTALLAAAKADGYSDPVIIEDKESAVRLSEAERSGISRLYSEIDKNNVAAVYVYELSRLSRRPDVIYSVRDRLISAGVQLVVVNPSIRLLRPDGRMDENANVLIGIFCAMAENEGYIRKARLARGKAKARAEGRRSEGPPPYGYQVNRDKTVSPDPEQAEIVRRIYREYNGGKSSEAVARGLMADGVKSGTIQSVKGFVLHILHNCAYCGRDTSENNFIRKPVNGRRYPAIVTEAEYDRAAETFVRRGKYCKTSSKYPYLCRGILTGADGIPFKVYTGARCYRHVGVEGDSERWTNVKVDFIDGLVWDLVEKAGYDPAALDTSRRERRAAAEQDIRAANERLAAIREERSAIERRAVKGRLAEEEADRMEDELDVEEAALRSKITAAESRISEIDAAGYDTNDRAAAVRDRVLNVTFEPVDRKTACVTVIMSAADSPAVFEMNRITGKCRRIM